MNQTETENEFDTDQLSALRSTRLRWVLALLVNLPLPFIALPLAGQTNWIQEMPGDSESRAMMIAVVVGIVAVLAGMFARNQAYKQHWRGPVVGPAGYVKGTTRFFMCITAGSLVLFTLGTASGYPAPTIAAAPVIIGLLVFNYPNGKPMLPAPPRLDTHPDEHGDGT